MIKRSRSSLGSNPITGWSVMHWASTPRGMPCPQPKKTTGTFRPLEHGLVAECPCHRGVAVRAGVPGPDVWLVLRRTWGEASELKGYLSNAPGHIPITALVRVAGMRWPIEMVFEESK